MKVIQITDPHLRTDPEAVLHGWHVEQAWRRVFDDAMVRHPDADLWALTGDLVDDETEAGYQRLNRQLEALPCPVLALAGNHDDPQAMQRCLTHAHVHENISLGGWQLYALNSHIDGSAAGKLGEDQLARLRDALEANNQPTIIFVHHPPVTVGSHWIDKIGLVDRSMLRHLLVGRAHVVAVICGHAHQAFESDMSHIKCWGTPSTMRQFLPGTADFALDTNRYPGYRVIALHADGRAISHVQRVATPSTPTCG